tara:strand:- start:401 stop:535 length:135 start_codon:yes stop_codon:yes gene_type:complete
LKENIGSEAIKLETTHLEKIENALNTIDIQGARYPEQMQKMIEN